MCGIIGIIKNDVKNTLLESLSRLEYRGYDSCGVCILEDNKIEISKTVGTVKKLANKVGTGTYGIGHTRWATNGIVNEANAHPHYSDNFDVVGVHNGIVENSSELKQKLISHGYSFYSDTDSEVLIKLIDYYHKKFNLRPDDAINKALLRAKGNCAVLLMFKEYSNQIWFGKNGLPLIIGTSDTEICIASDIFAFPKSINKIYYVDDNECGYIEANSPTFFDLNGTNITSSKKAESYKYKSSDELGVFHHWMLKEINDISNVADTLANKYNIQSDIFAIEQDYKFDESMINRLHEANTIALLGCGSSYNAAKIFQHCIKSKDLRVEVYNAGETMFEFKEDLDILEGSTVIAISQSGETEDVIRSVKALSEYDVKIIVITNNINSSLAKLADWVLDMSCSKEIAVAATKSFIATLILLSTIATITGNPLGLNVNPYTVKELTNKLDYYEYQVQQVAPKLVNYDKLILIGSDVDYYVAKEIALKLKECCYIYTDVLKCSELKHGTLALIDDKALVISLSSNDYSSTAVFANQQVQSRGGKILSISTGDDYVDELIKLFDGSVDTIFTQEIIVGQLLAYYLAIEKGINPDKPRNLAKSVTVK